MFTRTEINAITRLTPATHSQLDQRETQGGFAATLEERARADAQARPSTGPKWWLDKLMAPVRSQQPPASEYQLAKAENSARAQLQMRPNPDTLYIQILEEKLAALRAGGAEPTPEMVLQAMKETEEAVDKIMAQWEAEQGQQREAALDAKQLSQFDALQSEVNATLAQGKEVQETGIDMINSTQRLFNAQRDSYHWNIEVARQQKNAITMATDAQNALKEIHQAQQETAYLAISR